MRGWGSCEGGPAAKTRRGDRNGRAVVDHGSKGIVVVIQNSGGFHMALILYM